MNKLIVRAVGGYCEFGKNCTILRYGKEFIILDFGQKLNDNCNKKDSFPSTEIISNLILQKNICRGLFLSHGHLDHMGGLKKISLMKKPITVYGSSFTIDLVKKPSYNNITFEKIEFGKEFKKGIFTIKYLPVSHSIPQSGCVLVYTPGGNFLYYSDFKIDFLEQTTNTLKSLKTEKIDIMTVDTTRIFSPITYSELIASLKIQEQIIFENENSNLIIVSTFSTHLKRLERIIKTIKKLKTRKIFILGSSFKKILKIGVINKLIDENLLNDVIFLKNLDSRVKEIIHNKKNYVLIMSGHQREPNSYIMKLFKKEKGGLKLNKNDVILFSSVKITNFPTYQNTLFEKKIKENEIKFYENIHESGHAGRRGHRHVLNMLKPTIMIPTHGSLKAMCEYTELAKEYGYELNENLFLLKNNDELKYNKNDKKVEIAKWSKA